MNFFYVFQVTSGMNQMHVSPGESYDPNDLPPPPPEMLQQQYLYGTVPDSRQQAVFSQRGYPGGQARQGYAPGTGVADDVGVPAQQAKLANIPPSKPYEVRVIVYWIDLIESIHRCVHTHVCMHTQLHMHTHTQHTFMRACIYAYIHCMHAYTHFILFLNFRLIL